MLLDAEKGAFDGLALSSLTRPQDVSGLMARLQLAEKGKADSFAFVPRNATRALHATVSRLSVAGDKTCMRLEARASVSLPEQDAARDAAERANAAKSDFLARVSHEIRTPLNAIIGFAEVMTEERFGPVGSERYKDYLKDILASGRHVLSLVNDLLDLSKIEAGKMDLAFAAVDANAVIGECVSIMQPQANHSRIVMRQALAPVLPPIQADIRALRQILLNLLSNAIKFTPAGGQVIVSTTLSDAGYVLIRVKDTGVGMTEEEVRLALEPFTQIAPVSDMRGTGLGLPLTKALVEASHASFTIRSRRQEGTLVEIAFPLPEVRAAE
jgi:signal transduction histidine kinase